MDPFCCTAFAKSQSIAPIILSSFTFILSSLSAKTSKKCEDLRCRNGSPCRVISDGHMTRAECVCQQGLVGRTCQTKVKLIVMSVTKVTIQLKVEKMETENFFRIVSENYNTSEVQPLIDERERTAIQNSNYSLYYWKGNFSNMCNIVSMVRTSVVTVTGLRNNTEYTFCLITDKSLLCNLDLVDHYGNISYCATARTSKSSISMVAGSVSPELFYTVIVACVVIVALVILIAVVIISVRKKYFTHLIGARKQKRKHSQPKKGLTLDDSVTQETFLLTTPTTNQRISLNPPSSPGKPKNQLVNAKVRGYAPFSAKADQAIALSTVIEYADDDGHSDDSFYDNQDDQQQVMFLKRGHPLP